MSISLSLYIYIYMYGAIVIIQHDVTHTIMCCNMTQFIFRPSRRSGILHGVHVRACDAMINIIIISSSSSSSSSSIVVLFLIIIVSIFIIMIMFEGTCQRLGVAQPLLSSIFKNAPLKRDVSRSVFKSSRFRIVFQTLGL